MEVFALHRYFLQANKMRAHYYELMERDGAARVDDDAWPEQFLHMCLWYGCLFVVVEGWSELGLSDPEIESLLASPNVALLKRFRNGVFHYQRDYWDERFVGFIGEGVASVDWVRALNRAFGRYFLEWFDSRK